MANNQTISYRNDDKGKNSDGKTTIVNINLFSFEFNGNRIEIRGWHVIAFLLLVGGGTAYVTQAVHLA